MLHATFWFHKILVHETISSQNNHDNNKNIPSRMEEERIFQCLPLQVMPGEGILVPKELGGSRALGSLG